MPGSAGQRRGSPVSVMAPAVAPWYERYRAIDLVAARVPAGELDCIFVRLRTTVREEASAQIARRHLREETRQLGPLVVSHRRPDRAEPISLILDRLHELRVLVADRRVDELRREIEVALPVVIPEVPALRPGDR